jgi:serine/threonine-protein phosphatase 5
MYLRSEKKLHKRYALQIVLKATEIFSRECTVVDVTIPEGLEITVYGDVHGQFYDLLHTFDFNGVPSATNPVIFNGDFVDRGSFSVEIILVLLALKCCYPQSVFLNRGNHETENMNKIYGFEGEVKVKLGMEYMRPFADCFRAMPLACVIDSKILVLHGGLFSQDGVTLDMMRQVNRFMEPPDAGIMTDMLWSDPQRMPGRSPSKRGVGVQFGPDVTKRFLDANNLKMLIRSHECKDRGYEVRALSLRPFPLSSFPSSLTLFLLQIEADGRLVTIFSAPNYCDQMGNEGAIIRIGKDLECKYKQFKAVPHPQVRSVLKSALFFHRSRLSGSPDGLRWWWRLHEPLPIVLVNSVAL